MYFVAKPNEEAKSFIQAAGLTDETQMKAIGTLVFDLKNYNIWDKMKAVYPFVGQSGVSSSFQFNLKDPRNTDSAFRLKFSGSWTYSPLGVQSDGTGSYADTFLIPDTHLINNNTYITTYTTTAMAINDLSIGVYSGSGATTYVVKQYDVSTKEFQVYDYLGSGLSRQTGNTGLFGAGRLSTTTRTTQANSTAVSVGGTNTYPNISPYSFYIGAMNAGNTPYGSTAARIAFSSIGYGLTTTEAANLYTAVQRFQTTLGRQV
jgi:hypothetical protein